MYNSKAFNCVLFGFIISLMIIMIANHTQKNQENAVFEIKKKKCKKFYDTNEIEDDNTMLARNIVIGKKLQQEIKQEQFTKNDIDNYFDSHMDFYNKINFDSNNNHDVVEQIGEDRLENVELSNNQGKTIGEIFDNYTKNIF